jgi:hypothetical protein
MTNYLISGFEKYIPCHASEAVSTHEVVDLFKSQLQEELTTCCAR